MSVDITPFTVSLEEAADHQPVSHEDTLCIPANRGELTPCLDHDNPLLSRFGFPERLNFCWKEYLLERCSLVIGAGISGLVIGPDGRFLKERFPNQVPASINHLVNKLYREAKTAGELPEREPLKDILINFDNEWFNHYHLSAITLPQLCKHVQLRSDTAAPVLPDPAIDLPARQNVHDYLNTLLRTFGLSPGSVQLLQPGIYPVENARFLIPRRGPIDLVSSDSYRTILDRVGCTRRSPAKRDIFFARGNARNRREADHDEHSVFERLRKQYPRLEWIVADSLTMGQQISLVRDARSMSALHGAALSNMIFAERGTLEINERGTLDPSGKAFRPHFYHLAISRGFRYRLVS